MKLNNRGFTLVEVLAVIVILGIIAGIAAPNVLSTINNSKEKSYDIMIKNIITASKSLYQEVEYGGEIHKYTSDEETDTEEETTETNTDETNTDKTNTDETNKDEDIIIAEDTDKVEIKNNTITINLQTLVSNGFLSGTCQNNEEKNCKKTIINPKTGNDIGNCNIKIAKSKDESGKVTYNVTAEGTESEDCPKTEDYSKGLN